MPDPDDARWIKSTANELNNLLQVIAESGELLSGHCNGAPGADRYSRMLRESVDRAVSVTRSIVERLGEPNSLAALAAGEQTAAGPSSTGLDDSQSGIRIHNPTGTRELILIVDDEDYVTELATIVLSEEGYRTVTAKDGMQAIDIYRRMKGEIALVILDFTMPVMDGADVFAALQRINPRVPVVLSSGFAEQDRLRLMLSRGLRGFIPKPYSSKKLLDQVRQTLDATRAERG